MRDMGLDTDSSVLEGEEDEVDNKFQQVRPHLLFGNIEMFFHAR